MTTSKPSSLFNECEYCRKISSPTIKIRACTRCYSVGYCSKACQRAHWQHPPPCSQTSPASTNNVNKHGQLLCRGHKSSCVPTPKPFYKGDNNDNTVNTKIIGAEESSSTGSSLGNPNIVRLEMKRPGEGDGSWEDVGPINLIENLDEAKTNSASFKPRATNTKKTLRNNNASSEINTSKPHYEQSRPIIHTKTLSTSCQRILNSFNSNTPLESTYKYRHSPDGVDENLLIFFHGAGDSHLPYDELGKKMALPQTATLALSASLSLQCDDNSSPASFVELPFGLGHTWFEEMDYELTGETLANDHPRRLKSLCHAVKAVDSLLCSLTGSNGGSGDKDSGNTWIPERVFLFGFSAGACLLMELCRMLMLHERMPLGGAICIAGGIKNKNSPFISKNGIAESSTIGRKTQPTDVLIIAGSNDSVYSKSAAMKSKEFYQPHSSKVQIHLQRGKGHEMIKSEDEMHAVMKFLSKRLVRRMVSMEGLSDISK